MEKSQDRIDSIWPVHPARQFWKALEQEAQEQEAREQKARTPGLGRRRFGAVKYGQVHQKTELAYSQTPFQQITLKKDIKNKCLIIITITQK